MRDSSASSVSYYYLLSLLLIPPFLLFIIIYRSKSLSASHDFCVLYKSYYHHDHDHEYEYLPPPSHHAMAYTRVAAVTGANKGIGFAIGKYTATDPLSGPPH